MDKENILVIGGGLAGCEAAWQVAEGGYPVTLYEMKPKKKSPAHHSDFFAELVCSNSLKANNIENATGLLKEELRLGGSLLLACADSTAVPAGGALAVDRVQFGEMVTEKIKNHPLITVISEEVTEIPQDKQVIIATGPLTSDQLAENIANLFPDEKSLFFFDAAAPIVSYESIDMNHAYFAARYDKGTPDYVNCPMNQEEYTAFWQALTTAQEADVHGFEEKLVFEGCKPVEVEARRGEQTLLFGCLKPVGLPDPKTGRDPYAVVQLRKENAEGSMYNLVGFQTHLKFPEQQRVFSMIPALKEAEFLRYGVMHRNTFLNSPKLLDRSFRLKQQENIMFAGQITGVEGYVESIASGWVAARELLLRLEGKDPLLLPQETATGALSLFISDASVTNFQPMKMNFSLISSLDIRVKGGKRARNALKAKRGLKVYCEAMGLPVPLEESPEPERN